MEGAEEEPPEDFCVMNYEDDYKQALCSDGDEVLLPEYGGYLEQVKGLTGILFDFGL